MTAHLWSNPLLRAFLVCSLSAGLVSVSAQSPPASDPLAPAARLLGHWTGTSEGQPGKGEVERQYERVLGSRFIQVRNQSKYPPQEKNPKGETRETYVFSGPDQLEEIFEIAEPGKDFELYSRSRLTRVR